MIHAFMFIALTFFTLSLNAQCLVSYHSASANEYARSYTLSPAAPAGGVVGTNLTLVPLATTGFPMGGMAVDQVRRCAYYSNGLQLVRMPLLGVIAGLGPFGVLPNPAGFNQVTGLACNDTTGTLWATDGWAIAEVNPNTGALISGPFAGPFTGLNIKLTGLEFDQGTGEVLAVVEDSRICRFSAAGVLLGITLPPFVPAAPATGLAMDSSAPGKPLYISYNNTARHFPTGIAVPLANPAAQGLAFVALPAELPQGAVCGAMTLDASVNTPVYSGNAGFQLNLANGPIAAAVILGLDLGFLGAPIVLPSGSNLWLNPATLVTILLPTDAFGNAFLNAPLVVPPGFAVYAQWAAICPTNGMLYTSDMLQTITSEL
jgi:hypothetical protein